MKNTDLQKLMQQLQQPKFSHESRLLANELILEYNITEYDDFADLLEVDSHLNGQKAVRYWVNQQLPYIDADETPNERYRQLRHRFQDKLKDLV
ncbi:hypothetical protein AB6N28_08980 [Moraxella osloensis]|uniref:hypothetical protein n=1 Tax=Faucicola osloensis TaxID=34062 RepID=UPI0034DF720A